MKKVLLVLVLGFTFMSCSKEEDCGICFETVYQDLPDTCFYPNGLPYTCWNTYQISLEEVECQEEIQEDLENGTTRIIHCQLE